MIGKNTASAVWTIQSDRLKTQIQFSNLVGKEKKKSKEPNLYQNRTTSETMDILGNNQYRHGDWHPVLCRCAHIEKEDAFRKPVIENKHP